MIQNGKSNDMNNAIALIIIQHYYRFHYYIRRYGTEP